MKLTELLDVLLHSAEVVVPIFIHNSKSQKIEAVIFGAAEEAVAAHQALAEKRAGEASK